MASENGLSPRLAAFQGDSFSFPCVEGERSSQGKVRPAGFAAVGGEKIFSGEREARFLSDLHRRRTQTQGWGGFMDGGSHTGDGPNDEEEEEEEEDAEGNEEDEDVDDGDGLVSLEEGNNKINYNSSGSVQSSSDKICDERAISQEHRSSFGKAQRKAPIFFLIFCYFHLVIANQLSSRIGQRCLAERWKWRKRVPRGSILRSEQDGCLSQCGCGHGN